MMYETSGAITLLIYGLATFRLSHLIVREAGPFFMMKRFRAFVVREAPKKSHLDEGIKCHWCVSIWCGIIFTSMLMFQKQFPYWLRFSCTFLVLALALSAIAVIINRVVKL